MATPRIKTEPSPIQDAPNALLYQTSDTATMSAHSSFAGDIPMGDGVSPDQFRRELFAQSGQAPQGADEQLDRLGRPVQRLVEVINELEQLGVETEDLPLPKIIVVGDQSAGKSSLIEGISGIKVPRSGGTCTRCPLQITLFSSAEENAAWTCQVSLQQKYSFHTDADTTQGRYGKWSEDHTPTTTHFAVVSDKDELQNMISRAQWATLNPGDNPMKYLHAPAVEDLPLKVGFSPNKVILDITAPHQPNLSFIDLPGIICQTATKQNDWLVKLVENFVIDYIEQGNSLILLARSMDVDLTNSKAAALIDQCRALGRTVGCLTKPDRLPEGSKITEVQKVLGGTEFAVGHGYFVTRQPHQGQLNDMISSEEARKMENEFFAQAPWTTELQEFQGRFGTFRLRDSLSALLIQQILENLPEIKEKVNQRFQSVEEELSHYPDPPENPLGRVLESLAAFNNSVEKHLQGVHSYDRFRNALKDLGTNFQASLNKLRPTLIVSTPEKYRQSVEVPTFSLLSDDEGDQAMSPCPSMPPKPQSRKRNSVFKTPGLSKKIKVDAAVPGNTPESAGVMLASPKKKTFRLLEIRETLSRLSISGVPNEIDPRAVDHIRQSTLEGWEEPMLEFIDNVNKEIQGTLDSLLQEACQQWLTTPFFAESRNIVKTFASKAIAEQLRYAKRALTLEQRKPFTLNEEGFIFHRDKELAVLKEARITQRLIEKLETADLTAGRLMADKGDRKKKALTDLKARADLGEDPFAQEMTVMAGVRGYHTVALLRFLDHVMQGVQVEMIDVLVNELPEQLKLGLQVGSGNAQQHCKELLVEDRVRETRRVNLKKERDNLILAHHKLANLEQLGEGAAYPI